LTRKRETLDLEGKIDLQPVLVSLALLVIHTILAPTPGRWGASEPVHDLWSSKARKAKVTNCKLVLSFRSQFSHHLRHFSNQANERSTTQRLGSTAKVRSSFRLATVTVAPRRLCTASAKGCPVLTATATDQHVRHRGQAILMFPKNHQGAFSAGDIRCRNGNRMGKPLRIHGTMAFDTRYLLPRVVTFLFRRICILHALRINDHEAGLLVPTTADTDPRQPYFFTPAQAG